MLKNVSRTKNMEFSYVTENSLSKISFHKLYLKRVIECFDDFLIISCHPQINIYSDNS